MTSYYNAKNQRDYNSKQVFYSVKYISNKESDIIDCIDKAIVDSGLTKQAWIKQAIIDKLVKDGYME